MKLKILYVFLATILSSGVVHCTDNTTSITFDEAGGSFLTNMSFMIAGTNILTAILASLMTLIAKRQGFADKKKKKTKKNSGDQRIEEKVPGITPIKLDSLKRKEVGTAAANLMLTVQQKKEEKYRKSVERNRGKTKMSKEQQKFIDDKQKTENEWEKSEKFISRGPVIISTHNITEGAILDGNESLDVEENVILTSVQINEKQIYCYEVGVDVDILEDRGGIDKTSSREGTSIMTASIKQKSIKRF